MGIKFEVYDSSSSQWVDKTSKLIQFKHSLTSRELEKIDFALVDEDVTVGEKVRVKRNGNIFFEGVVYERRKRHDGSYVSVEATAYSYLILYDRHVVFRLYSTGTTAGAIIKDLASLEENVDVTNVDDGDQLLSDWSIENENALKIMQDVAKGVNYWLRMTYDKKLYFKPKTEGTPVATINSDNVVNAEYSEDRWKLKNRVIYVGANGEILADVSEGAGDLPEVVHDPFLTDSAEAQRRANIRLALNKEYGKQLRVEMNQYDFEAMNIGLGDTVTVNLPSLGLSNVNMFLVEVEYDPHELKYFLTLGGKLELFEELFEEAIGGDVASRFGPKADITSVVGEIYNIKSTLHHVRRVQSISLYRYIAYLNKRPLTVHQGENIRINTLTGECELASGFTSGYAEIRFLPPSEKFRRWGYVEWLSYKGDGYIVVKLMDTQGNVLAQREDYLDGFSLWKRLYLNRWPKLSQAMTRYPAIKDWASGMGARPMDSRTGFLTGSCIRLEPLSYGSLGEIIYPSAKNLGLDLSWAKYLTLFLYTFDENVTFKIRLYTNESNYFEGVLSLTQPNIWREYVVSISSLSQVGEPDLGNVDWIGFLADYPVLIDSDYVFHQYGYEELRVKFEMYRPSASAVSPRIGKIIITYEEAMT